MGLVFLNRKPTKEDKEKLWLASWGKNDESIEIRRTITSSSPYIGGSPYFAQILIIVYKGQNNIKISMNGTCYMNMETFYEIDEIVSNAVQLLID
jgi:hypothetical protein